MQALLEGSSSAPNDDGGGGGGGPALGSMSFSFGGTDHLNISCTSLGIDASLDDDEPMSASGAPSMDFLFDGDDSSSLLVPAGLLDVESPRASAQTAASSAAMSGGAGALSSREQMLRSHGDSSSESQSAGWGDEAGIGQGGNDLDDSWGDPSSLVANSPPQSTGGSSLFGGGGLFSPSHSAFSAPSDSGCVGFSGFGSLDRARSDGTDMTGDSRLLKSFARSQSEPTSNGGGPE